MVTAEPVGLLLCQERRPTHVIRIPIVKQGTTQSLDFAEIQLVSSGSTSVPAAAAFGFIDGDIFINSFTGTSGFNPERYRDGWWKISIASSAAIPAATAWQFWIQPAQVSTDIGDVYIFGANMVTR